MLPAEEVQQVAEGLWFWQRWQPSVKTDCSSCALQVGGRLIFIDPIPLAPDALAELTAQAEPAAIIATNGNHDRALAALRKKLGLPIFAHAAAVPALGLPVDRTLEDGETLFDSLQVITLPGAGAGEIALHDPRGRLHLGDALTHLDPTGLAILPDKYCAAPRELHAALRKLLPFEFEILTFAHGLPLTTRARSRLASLLA